MEQSYCDSYLKLLSFSCCDEWKCLLSKHSIYLLLIYWWQHHLPCMLSSMDIFPVMYGQLTSCIWLKDSAQVKEELCNWFSAYYLISFLITNPPDYVCGLGFSYVVNYMGPSKWTDTSSTALQWHLVLIWPVYVDRKQHWNLLLAAILVQCIVQTQVSLAKVWFCSGLTESWFCPCVRWFTLDQIPCNCNSFHELQ